MVINDDLIRLEQAPLLALVAAAKTGLSLSAIAYGAIAPLTTWIRMLLAASGFLLLLI